MTKIKSPQPIHSETAVSKGSWLEAGVPHGLATRFRTSLLLAGVVVLALYLLIFFFLAINRIGNLSAEVERDSRNLEQQMLTTAIEDLLQRTADHMEEASAVATRGKEIGIRIESALNDIDRLTIDSPNSPEWLVRSKGVLHQWHWRHIPEVKLRILRVANYAVRHTLQTPARGNSPDRSCDKACRKDEFDKDLRARIESLRNWEQENERLFGELRELLPPRSNSRQLDRFLNRKDLFGAWYDNLTGLAYLNRFRKTRTYDHRVIDKALERFRKADEYNQRVMLEAHASGGDESTSVQSGGIISRAKVNLATAMWHECSLKEAKFRNPEKHMECMQRVCEMERDALSLHHSQGALSVLFNNLASSHLVLAASTRTWANVQQDSCAPTNRGCSRRVRTLHNEVTAALENAERYINAALTRVPQHEVVLTTHAEILAFRMGFDSKRKRHGGGNNGEGLSNVVHDLSCQLTRVQELLRRSAELHFDWPYCDDEETFYRRYSRQHFQILTDVGLIQEAHWRRLVYEAACNPLKGSHDEILRLAKEDIRKAWGEPN